MFTGRDGKRLEALESEGRELRRELSELGDGLQSLEHRMESVTADSLLQWEKVNRALGRLAKRSEAQATEQDGPTRGNSPLTDEQKNEIIRAGGDPWLTPS